MAAETGSTRILRLVFQHEIVCFFDESRQATLNVERLFKIV